MAENILEFLNEVIENNGIFELKINSNKYYKSLKNKQTLPDWRVNMVDMFFYDHDEAALFSIQTSGSHTKSNRLAKKSVFKSGDDWCIDFKILMNMNTIEEVTAFRKIILLMLKKFEKTKYDGLLFTNEYDRNGRIFLGIEVLKETGMEPRLEILVPEIEIILKEELFEWQKRFAKDIRAMGRYSFFRVDARAFYGKKWFENEFFKDK